MRQTVSQHDRRLNIPLLAKDEPCLTGMLGQGYLKKKELNYDKKKQGDSVGDSIPGSRLIRDYCCRCGTPMRVTMILQDSNGRNVPSWCERCSPKHMGCSSPPSPFDPDANGSFSNVVGAIEDDE